MRCLYCGNKLSLLRKFSDGKFCSDAHREAHQRLQDELALTRLADSRSRTAGPKPPASSKAKARTAGIPPHAPLLPQAVVWTDCRRIVPLPVQLAEFAPVQFLPESCLRVIVRGFPAPSAAAWQPAPPKPAPSAVFVILPADPLPAEPVQPLDPGQRAPAAPAALQPLPPAQPIETSQPPEPEPAAPPQPRLPLAIVFCRPLTPPALDLRPLYRRKLVVIAPKSGLRVGPGRFHQAPAVPWALPPKPVHAASCRHAGGAAASLAPPSQQALPARSASLDPPDWVKPAPGVAGEPDLTRPAPEPPLCLALLALAAPPPVRPAAPLPALAFPPLAPTAQTTWTAASGLPAILAAPRLQPQLRLEAAALAPQPPAACLAAQACWVSDAEPRQLPMPRRSAPAARPAWPLRPGLSAVAAPPAGSAAQPHAVAPAPEAPAAAEALLPEVSLAFPPRQLRLAHRMLPVAAPEPASLPAARAALSPAPDWNPACPAPPALRLELQPPEPSCPAPPALEEIPDAGLHALGRAVAGDAPPAAAQDSSPELTEPLPPQPAPSEPPVQTSADLPETQEPTPGLCPRLPMMPVRPVDSFTKPAVMAAASVRSCWASLDDLRPAHPLLRLELDHADGSGPRSPGARSRPAKKLALSRGKRRFWAHAPSDLKWIAVTLPLLLVLVVYSFNANKPNNPAGDTGMTSTATAPAAGQAAQPWIKANAIQRFIMRRAGVRLFDDFRSGLGSWQGNGGWANTWRYGDATFVQPGDLALLSPSLGLSDYTLTFLGQIERRSLNWVFRARDLENYYSMRIAVTRGGPLPEAVLIRSLVLNGKEREVKTLPIPFPVQADTLYLVRMEVRGQDFTTYIQNQIVDHFSDSRLKSGGVGFYSPRGDRALLRWVEVSHQYDYLGRLCALLSPYGVQGLPAE